MDRMLYVAMTGAQETLRAQTVNNHNLANVATTGFRADLAAFQDRIDGLFDDEQRALARHGVEAVVQRDAPDMNAPPPGINQEQRGLTGGREVEKDAGGDRCRFSG